MMRTEYMLHKSIDAPKHFNPGSETLFKLKKKKKT